MKRLVYSVLKNNSTSTAVRYFYDNVGNRLSGGGGFKYNLTNSELTSSNLSFTFTAYGYDRNGNLVSKNIGTTSQWTYSWDVPGNLLSVSNNSGVQGYYAYDGLERRVEAKEGSSTVFYGYLGTETLAEGPVNPYTDYIYANGLRIARVTGAYVGGSPAIFYFHTDALGSTRLITDASKNVLFTDNYQPYGQDNQSTGAETYKFTGKPVSATTGLYYYYHRWYDPATGRFLSQDPQYGQLSDPQSLNQYVYVKDSPLNNKDPSGEIIEVVIGAVAGGLIGWGLCGFSFSNACLAQAGAGALTGALAGATFGLSLGAMGVTGTVAATLPEALAAGAISGTISGIASFDINVFLGKEQANLPNLLTDAGFGLVTGLIGGGISSAFGDVKEALSPSDLEKSGNDFLESASNLVGRSAPKISKIGLVVIGGSVELGKGVVTGAVEPVAKWLVSVFTSTSGTQSTAGPVVWHDIGNHRG
jgi:RHS repeat-associated protein